MYKITPFLWFDKEAEDAALFYVSIFKNAKITKMVRNQPSAPGPTGQVMTVVFELDGQTFTALNGGPMFTFNQAVSFVVDCEDQAEVDYLWGALSLDGQEGRCGWLKDKFGLSWQIVPSVLPQLLGGRNAEGSERAMKAMLQMNKLDIAALTSAYAGVSPAP